MSTAKKILSNTVTQMIGRAIMALSSVVILKAIANFLSVEGYGMYTAIYEFLAFFGIVADLGLFTIAIREMGKGERSREFIIGNIFAMRLVMGVIAMSLAVLSAFLIPKYNDTYIPIGVAIASISVFFAIMHGTVSSVLQVELKMERATIGLVVGKLISLAWMLIAIYYVFDQQASPAGFYQLIVAGVVGNLFAFLYTFWYALKYTKIRPQFVREYWVEIFKTSVPYGTALVLSMIYFRIGSIMLLFMRGPTEVGLFGVPMRVLEILSVIPVYFMNSTLPSLSAAIKNGGEKVTRILELSFQFLWMAALPIVTGVWILAYPIIFIIASPEFLSRVEDDYYGSDIALKILAFAMFFSFLNSLFTYALVAVNKQSHLLWINGSAAVLNIAANFIVIPLYGFRGAGVITVLTEIYILTVAWLVARKYLSFKFKILPFVKIIVATAVMGVVVYFLREPSYHWLGFQNLNVLVLAVLGAIIYLALLYLFGAIPQEFLRRKVRE